MNRDFLGNVVEVILGGTPKTTIDDYWNGDIFWITPGDLDGSKHVSVTAKSITSLGLQKSNTKLLSKNDVVISARGSVGKLVEIDQPMALNQSCYAIRTKDESSLLPQYVFYLMQVCVAYLKQNSGGAVFDAIIKSTLERTPILLPSIDTQEKIADILSAYDDLIENNRRRIELLEESARQLYKEWFVRFRFPGHEHVEIIDGVPEGWEEKTLFDCVDVLSGGTPKTKELEFWDGNIPFFTPKDTGKGPYTYHTEKMITEAGLTKCNSKRYEKDTLFITARGTVGKLRLAQRPMAMNQSCYALKSKTFLSQSYLYFAVTERVNHLKSRAGGAVFDAIVVDTFKKIPFFLPNETLAQEFSEFVKDNLRQIDLLSNQSRQLVEARDLLLPKLMSGEIAV